MNILHFKNLDIKTPFAPKWDYCIFETNIINFIDLDFIKDMILLWEPKLINQYQFTSDWGTGLGEESLTSRANSYNLLRWPEMSPLRSAIRKMHDVFIEELKIKDNEKIYAQCWANVMRENQDIKMHQHWNSPYTYLGGHVTIQCNNTSTYYVNPYTRESYESKNEEGKLTLFPNWIEHYTDLHTSKKERITIAFDIITETVYNEDIYEDKKDHWVSL